MERKKACKKHTLVWLSLFRQQTSKHYNEIARCSLSIVRHELMGAEANTSKRHTDHQRERDKAKAEWREKGGRRGQYKRTAFRFRFRFRFFIHQVLQQGKCVESGKHTNISKQQHWRTSTSNPFALTKQYPNDHTPPLHLGIHRCHLEGALFIASSVESVNSLSTKTVEAMYDDLI